MLGPEWEGEPPGEPPWKSGRIPVSGSAGASPSQALRQIHAQSFDGGGSGGPAPTPNTEHWHLSSYQSFSSRPRACLSPAGGCGGSGGPALPSIGFGRAE